MVIASQSSPLVSVRELVPTGLGELNLNQFDFKRTPLAGALYTLSLQQVHALAEAIGFTARFDNENLKTAYLEVRSGIAIIVCEMPKNTKPTEIGLRYLADRWNQLERSHPSGQNPPARSSLRLTFQARLPKNACDMFAKGIHIDPVDNDLFYTKVNFKDCTYTLVVEQDQKQKLPGGAIHSFSLNRTDTPIGSENLDHETNEVDSVDTSKTNAAIGKVDLVINKAEPVPIPALNQVSASPKYATYSCSEVDLLLKKQAEILTNNLSSKISNQQRNLQEIFKAQEQKISKIVDDLKAYCETVRKNLENTNAKQLGTSQQLIEQANKALVSEIDQFKAYLNKQVTPNLKSLDDRILSIINAHSTEQKPESDQTTLTVAVLAILLSLVNFALLILRH